MTVGTVENPYVRDIHRFANDSRLGEQRLIVSMYRFNHLFVAIVGSFLTALLFYYLWRKTPEAIRQYSRILMLCCMTDAFYLVVEICCGVRYRFRNNVFLAEFLGPAGWTKSHRVLGIFYFFHITSRGLACTILPTQYFLKYELLRGENAAVRSKTGKLFSLALLGAASSGVFSYPSSVYSGDCRPDYDYGELWYPADPIPVLLIGNMGCSHWVTLHFIQSTLIITVCYGIALYYAYRTMHITERYSISNRTRNLQSQLNKALVVQTLVPLVVISLPVLVIFTTIVANVENGEFGTVVAMLNAWLPLLNSGTSIYFVVPYRRALIDVFKLPQQSIQK